MRSKKMLTILVLAFWLIICCQQVVFAGTIVGWGDNTYGKATPPAGSDYVAMAAGGHHGLALKADGSIVEWGYNSHHDRSVHLLDDWMRDPFPISHWPRIAGTI